LSDVFRVAIVGSGPAGLSAAARAAALGMSHVLLEKTDHLSDTIFKYQKGKHVMATPSNLVLRSDLEFDAGKREVILGTWDREADKQKINVRLNSEVVEITGDEGNFSIKFKDGETIVAAAVVLAIGTQGNPNKLRTPGADMPHISSISSMILASILTSTSPLLARAMPGSKTLWASRLTMLNATP